MFNTSFQILSTSLVLLIVAGQSSSAIAAMLPPTTDTLFVSTLTGKHTDEYLATMQVQDAGGWINCAVKVYGDGVIKRTYCDEMQKNKSVGIHRVRDYRVLNGQEWLFLSKKDRMQGDVVKHCVLDANGLLHRCFSMPSLDPHDFMVAPNGDRIYMFYEARLNEKKWFSGKPLDLVLRRVNASNEVVWQWNSAAYFSPEVKADSKKWWGSKFVRWLKEVRTSIITNVGVNGGKPLCITLGSTPRCMQMHYIDYLHANSLEWDKDGGIIVSARDINTIFKISLPGGNVEWRIGGYHAGQTDFKIINDPLEGFSYQHSAKLLANGNLLLFDNGNDRPDKKTRAVEYKMDWKNRTAEYLWSYPAPSDYAFRRCCGLVQRLKNGNTLIAWGGWNTDETAESIPVADEVTPTGKIAMEIRSRTSTLPYRVWKNEK